MSMGRGRNCLYKTFTGELQICEPPRRPRFDSWVGKIPWRKKWQPTPVLLPGKSHGQRSLVGYSSWGHKESDTTEKLHFPELRTSYQSLFVEVCEFLLVLREEGITYHICFFVYKVLLCTEYRALETLTVSLGLGLMTSFYRGDTEFPGGWGCSWEGWRPKTVCFSDLMICHRISSKHFLKKPIL